MKLSAVDLIDASEVERLHDLVIAASGGASGLRDPGLLASAVAAPTTSVDGNKRTAAAVVMAFLRMNGVHVDFEAVAWVVHFERVGSGELTLGDLKVLIAEAMGGDVEIEVDG